MSCSKQEEGGIGGKAKGDRSSVHKAGGHIQKHTRPEPQTEFKTKNGVDRILGFISVSRSSRPSLVPTLGPSVTQTMCQGKRSLQIGLLSGRASENSWAEPV